jgi:hypothetical protein
MTKQRRTIPEFNPRMRLVDENGFATPEFARWKKDLIAVLRTNQVATDATIVASAPSAIDSSGATVIYRPTTSAGSGYDQPAAAYDGNPSTPATAVIAGVKVLQRTWSGFSALQGSATLQSLKITSSILGVKAPTLITDVKLKSGYRTTAMVEDDYVAPDPVGGAHAQLEYTLNGGSTWNLIYSSSDVDSRTDVVDVPLSTKLGDVQVRATAKGLVVGAAITHKLLDIWIEVTP